MTMVEIFMPPADKRDRFGRHFCDSMATFSQLCIVYFIDKIKIYYSDKI